MRLRPSERHLDRWKQIGVTSEDDGDVVLTEHGALDEIDSESDVDTLLTRRMFWPASIVEIAAPNNNPIVASPRCGLRVVGSRQ